MLNDLEVKYARLKRKLDHTKHLLGISKNLNKEYKNVLDLSPYIKHQYDAYAEGKVNKSRIEELENRVAEQARLIQLLQQS
jgi:hypothetical protein